MPQFDADREQAVARARAAGVETMLIVGGVDAEAGHRRAVRVLIVDYTWFAPS